MPVPGLSYRAVGFVDRAKNRVYDSAGDRCEVSPSGDLALCNIPYGDLAPLSNRYADDAAKMCPQGRGNGLVLSVALLGALKDNTCSRPEESHVLAQSELNLGYRCSSCPEDDSPPPRRSRHGRDRATAARTIRPANTTSRSP